MPFHCDAASVRTTGMQGLAYSLKISFEISLHVYRQLSIPDCIASLLEGFIFYIFNWLRLDFYSQ